MKRFAAATVALVAIFAVGLAQGQTRTPWQMHDGLEVTASNPYGLLQFNCNPSKHGDPCLYNVATIPAEDDGGWFGAPDPEIINLVRVPSYVCYAPVTCMKYGDFSYFQTFVNIPEGTTVTKFTIDFWGMDDGSRITIFNSAYPGGLVIPGSYVYLGGSGTTNLAPYVVEGEVNRVVITQVDDCCYHNYLRSAKVNLNGYYIPPVTDTDGDGTPDDEDGCPYDAGKVAPGICGCGVSDVDSDGDGVADCLDGCPADPGKVAPGVCGCGVADVDSDLDGVLDCLDGCPADPGKVEPGICGCGVADVDTDGDGLADCIDECPLDPDNDIDLDGVCGDVDNCVDVANPDQANADGDVAGDACDECPYNPDYIVDDVAPTIECNAANIFPSDAPVAFTATAEDNCSVELVEITGYNCWAVNGAGKIISKLESCVVSMDGATLVITDGGGVGTIIDWTVVAVDEMGNSAEAACSLQVQKKGGTGGNQGVGNGPEGADPGNSNQGDPTNSNDENGGTPGNPGKGKKK